MTDELRGNSSTAQSTDLDLHSDQEYGLVPALTGDQPRGSFAQRDNPSNGESVFCFDAESQVGYPDWPNTDDSSHHSINTSARRESAPSPPTHRSLASQHDSRSVSVDGNSWERGHHRELINFDAPSSRASFGCSRDSPADYAFEDVKIVSHSWGNTTCGTKYAESVDSA